MYKKASRLSIYFLGLFLIAFGLWTSKYFGKVTVDQALSTLVFNSQGAIAANSSFTRRFMEWCLLWPGIVTLLIASWPLVRKLLGYFFLRTLPGKIMKYVLQHYFNLLLVVTGFVIVNHQYGLVDYVMHHRTTHADFFAEAYIDPAAVSISAKKPKSLVLIYVESLETTYSNTNLFRNDLLQRLTHLNVNHISFAHYQQMPGTGWSVAGIIATQCAVPLKLVTIMKDNDFGEDTAHVLPGAQCLGDILAAHGYKNIYMNGSTLDFAGVGKFFKDHHYSEMYGREEWLQKGVLTEKDMTGWGLSDDKLLEQAKIKLEELVQGKQLFNLTLFTIDTHGLSGQLSEVCAKAGYRNFTGIVECTSNQVADFVHYAEKKGWLDKVNIVIVGDHLAMQNLASKELDAVEERYIFNMIVSKNKLMKNTNEIVAFDILPTVLTSLGFSSNSSRLGLGYSAIGAENSARPEHRIASLKEKLLFNSKRYNQLWLEHAASS